MSAEKRLLTIIDEAVACLDHGWTQRARYELAHAREFVANPNWPRPAPPSSKERIQGITLSGEHVVVKSADYDGLHAEIERLREENEAFRNQLSALGITKGRTDETAEPRLMDRATGVQGVYCIGRVVNGTTEYWNGSRWAAFCGDFYFDLRAVKTSGPNVVREDFEPGGRGDAQYQEAIRGAADVSAPRCESHSPGFFSKRCVLPHGHEGAHTATENGVMDTWVSDPRDGYPPPLPGTAGERDL